MIERLQALLACVRDAATNPQFPAVAGTVILVVAGVVWGRRWYLARTNGHAGGVLADAFAVVAPYLAGLVVIGLALFAAGGKPRPWYEMAATLLALLAFIRLVVFLLRLSLGKSRTIKAWELRVTLLVWGLISAKLLGLLDPVIALLDSIGLTQGKTRVTIWSVLKAIALVTFFVVVSVWVARWIDRRINAIQELAPSTRIGIGKFAYAFLIALGILLGLQSAGVNLTALTVFSGAIGLGLGFGLQAIAANFVSGFVLLVDRSIKPGDVISFTGATGTSTTGFGWVEELRGRHVVVRDRELSDAQLSGMDAGWFIHELHESLKLTVIIVERVVGFSLSETMSPFTIKGTVLNNAGLEAVSGVTRPGVSASPAVEVQFVELSPADQSRIKAWVLGRLPPSFGSA